MTQATLLSAAVSLSAADAATANPLLTESTLPFHYPRFDLIKNAHFLPAYEAGMAAQLAEVAAIATNATHLESTKWCFMISLG